MLIWYDPSGAGLRAENGIVRADEMSAIARGQVLLDRTRQRCERLQARAVSQARASVEQARQEAQALLAQAHADVEAMRQDAALDIRRAGEERERQECVAWHARHAQLLAAHAASVRNMQERLAATVTAAVLRIVEAGPREQLFHRGLTTLRELMPRSSSIRMRVNPADAEAAQRAIAELPPSEDLVIEVKAEAVLSPGACIFESELGTLDSSLDVQLLGVRGALDRATLRAVEDAIAPTHGKPTHDEPTPTVTAEPVAEQETP